jgi:hypothetical protein
MLMMARQQMPQPTTPASSNTIVDMAIVPSLNLPALLTLAETTRVGLMVECGHQDGPSSGYQSKAGNTGQHEAG